MQQMQPALSLIYQILQNVTSWHSELCEISKNTFFTEHLFLLFPEHDTQTKNFPTTLCYQFEDFNVILKKYKYAKYNY